MLNKNMNIDFSSVSEMYQKASLVQSSAADILIQLLQIKGNEDILDLGCGPGHITRKLQTLTSGNLTGLDASEGMIHQAQQLNKDNLIRFLVKNAADLDFQNVFDIIFCNSSLQWWKNPAQCIRNCFRALKNPGRMGIQAPATNQYSPNFIRAVQNVSIDPHTKGFFSHFTGPWFLLETAQEYKTLFEQAGFTVPFAKIETVTTLHTPEEVFKIFESGAAVGYLNPACYNVPLDDSYAQTFCHIVKTAFQKQANARGKVELVFNRIYLLALKQ